MTNDVAAITSAAPVATFDSSVQVPNTPSTAADTASATSGRVSTKPQTAAHVEDALRSMDPPLMSETERLSIIRDQTTGTFIYRRVDTTTGEILNQWPAEAMIQFRAQLRNAEGVLFDQQA